MIAPNSITHPSSSSKILSSNRTTYRFDVTDRTKSAIAWPALLLTSIQPAAAAADKMNVTTAVLYTVVEEHGRHVFQL